MGGPPRGGVVWGEPPGGAISGFSPPHFDRVGGTDGHHCETGGKGRVWGGWEEFGGGGKDKLGVGGAPLGTPKFSPPHPGVYSGFFLTRPGSFAWILQREGGGRDDFWGGGTRI